ncbi:MAG: 30S ribosomal protein S6 [Desulfovibrionaceae bacterium]|nr:30S ribosomal protein S6 [Desulfovibrionaceae bacterium]MDD4952678.1 30S ribosomal protein S6 [Desulfovibrionaceae bacterium]
MRTYETLLLLSPGLAEETRKQTVDAFCDILDKQGGKVAETDDWGVRNLAYPVSKQTKGHYVRLVYDAPSQAVEELERNIRISDGVFKFLTVKLADKAEPEEA